MGSTINGVKAGVVAGILYGLVIGLLSYVAVVADKAAIISALTNSLPASSPFTPEQLYGIVLFLTPAIAAAGGIIGGIIVGAIYGRLFERIPGGTPMVRGILVGVILWFIISVLGDLSSLRYGVAVYLADIGVGLLSAVFFGFVLGYFYGRFTRQPTLDPAMQGL